MAANLARELLATMHEMSPQQPPQQSRGRLSSSIVEQFCKIHPPVFEGGPNPLAAEEWLPHLDIFKFMECTNAQKIFSRYL